MIGVHFRQRLPLLIGQRGEVSLGLRHIGLGSGTLDPLVRPHVVLGVRRGAYFSLVIMHSLGLRAVRRLAYHQFLGGLGVERLVGLVDGVLALLLDTLVLGQSWPSLRWGAANVRWTSASSCCWSLTIAARSAGCAVVKVSSAA